MRREISKARYSCKLLRVPLKLFSLNTLLISRECACYSRLSDNSFPRTQ